MGNTCGTCAFDNRGTEVDMKNSKQPQAVGQTQKQVVNQGYEAQYEQQDNYESNVNLDNSAEFLEPPLYQCDAVMAYRKNNQDFDYTINPNQDGQ